MPKDLSGEVNVLLERWVQGDAGALNALVPIVHAELRRVAHHCLRSERTDHTLQSTALVNEAFLRLIGSEPAQLESRAHFLAVAARLMRQILVDYSRNRGARKRDAGLKVDFEVLMNLPITENTDLVALDEALQALSRMDERQAKIVEMKFFGGMSAPEIATVLDISRATIDREWALARIWLHRQLREAPAS
jgi:RNA polymerase sigma-70 factor (ECF subfamily)